MTFINILLQHFENVQKYSNKWAKNKVLVPVMVPKFTGYL